MPTLSKWIAFFSISVILTSIAISQPISVDEKKVIELDSGDKFQPSLLGTLSIDIEKNYGEYDLEGRIVVGGRTSSNSNNPIVGELGSAQGNDREEINLFDASGYTLTGNMDKFSEAGRTIEGTDDGKVFLRAWLEPEGTEKTPRDSNIRGPWNIELGKLRVTEPDAENQKTQDNSDSSQSKSQSNPREGELCSTEGDFASGVQLICAETPLNPQLKWRACNTGNSRETVIANGNRYRCSSSGSWFYDPASTEGGNDGDEQQNSGGTSEGESDQQGQDRTPDLCKQGELNARIVSEDSYSGSTAVDHYPIRIEGCFDNPSADLESMKIMMDSGITRRSPRVVATAGLWGQGDSFRPNTGPILNCESDRGCSDDSVFQYRQSSEKGFKRFSVSFGDGGNTDVVSLRNTGKPIKNRIQIGLIKNQLQQADTFLNEGSFSEICGSETPHCMGDSYISEPLTTWVGVKHVEWGQKVQLKEGQKLVMPDNSACQNEILFGGRALNTRKIFFGGEQIGAGTDPESGSTIEDSNSKASIQVHEIKAPTGSTPETLEVTPKCPVSSGGSKILSVSPSTVKAGKEVTVSVNEANLPSKLSSGFVLRDPKEGKTKRNTMTWSYSPTVPGTHTVQILPKRSFIEKGLDRLKGGSSVPIVGGVADVGASVGRSIGESLLGGSNSGGEGGSRIQSSQASREVISSVTFEVVSESSVVTWRQACRTAGHQIPAPGTEENLCSVSQQIQSCVTSSPCFKSSGAESFNGAQGKNFNGYSCEEFGRSYCPQGWEYKPSKGVCQNGETTSHEVNVECSTGSGSD